jgi:hypothetical protein
MATDSDWRLRGQGNYLQGVTLIHRAYHRHNKNPDWEHDHCAFCWAKFACGDQPDVQHEGYSTEDDYYWICGQCFNDFKTQFQWRIIEAAIPNDAEESNGRSA